MFQRQLRLTAYCWLRATDYVLLITYFIFNYWVLTTYYLLRTSYWLLTNYCLQHSLKILNHWNKAKTPKICKHAEKRNLNYSTGEPHIRKLVIWYSWGKEPIEEKLWWLEGAWIYRGRTWSWSVNLRGNGKATPRSNRQHQLSQILCNMEAWDSNTYCWRALGSQILCK